MWMRMQMQMQQRGGVLEPVQRVPAFKYTTDPSRRTWTSMIYPYAPYFLNMFREIPWGLFYFDGGHFTAKCNSTTPYLIKGGTAFEIMNRTGKRRLHHYVDPTGDIDVEIPNLVVKQKPDLTNREFLNKLIAASKGIGNNSSPNAMFEVVMDVIREELPKYSYYSVMRGALNALTILNKRLGRGEEEAYDILRDEFSLKRENMNEYFSYSQKEFSYFKDARTLSPVGDAFTTWLISQIISYFNKLSGNFSEWFPNAVPFKKLGGHESEMADSIHTVGPFGIYRYVQPDEEEEGENVPWAGGGAGCKVQVAMNYKYKNTAGKEMVGQAVFIEFIIGFHSNRLAKNNVVEPHIYFPKFGLLIRDIGTEMEMNTEALMSRFRLLREGPSISYKFINHVKRAEYLLNAISAAENETNAELLRKVIKEYLRCIEFLTEKVQEGEENEDEDAKGGKKDAKTYLDDMLEHMPEVVKNTANDAEEDILSAAYGATLGGTRRKSQRHKQARVVRMGRGARRTRKKN
jgi:hypothetical protein